MECLLPYISMVDVPHKMVGLERMLDSRGVRLERFHCISSTLCSQIGENDVPTVYLLTLPLHW